MNVRTLVFAMVLSAEALARADDETGVPPAKDGVGTRVQLSPYVEAGGPSLFYSANADLRIGSWFALRGGFSAVRDGQCSDCDRQPGALWLFPVGVSLVGGEVHAWEMQVGGEYLAGGQLAGNDPRFVGFVGAGYRYQPRDEGFFFRASAYVLANREILTPWAGVSLGYALSLSGAPAR